MKTAPRNHQGFALIGAFAVRVSIARTTTFRVSSL